MIRPPRLCALLFAVPAVLLALLSPVAPALAQAAAPTNEELQQALAERERIIASMRAQILALERIFSEHGNAPETQLPHGERVWEADVRALERTLVREGGLVLRPPEVEVEPQVTYTHHGSDARRTPLTTEPEPTRRLESVEANLNVRIGLPWTTQLDVSLPYVYQRAKLQDASGGGNTTHGAGRGNVSVGITKQLLDDRPGMPGVLASLRWTDAGAAGNYEDPLAPRSAFASWEGALNVVKRHDPVVFFGGMGYTGARKRQIGGSTIEPGDMVSVWAGSLLALRPDTSLLLGLDIDRVRHSRQQRQVVPESDLSLAMLQFGFTYVLSPRLLLNVQAGAGLTADSPDYQVSVSLPYRF